MKFSFVLPALKHYVKISLAILVLVWVFLYLAPLAPKITLSHDEHYYIDRAMQNLYVYEGIAPASSVWFSSPNHPFAGELFIGLELVLQHQSFKPMHELWLMNETQPQSLAARYGSNFIAALAVAAIFLLLLDIDWKFAPLAVLFAISSNGVILTYQNCRIRDRQTALLEVLLSCVRFSAVLSLCGHRLLVKLADNHVPS